MKQISALELYYLVKELKVLEEQRIDNFYFVNGIFYIKVYLRGQGYRFLVNKVSKYLYVDTEKDDASEPSNFVQYLRKYLKNGIIQQLDVVENERIVKLVISKKVEEEIIEYSMYLELFANGNIILVDQEGKIKNSLLKKKFKDRDLLVHREYELPPERELSIFAIDHKKALEVSKEDPLPLVKFLAIKYGLGGKIAEEICVLAEVDKNIHFHELSKEQQEKVVSHLLGLSTRELDAHGVYDDDKLVDFVPFKFSSIKKKLAKFDTFNSLVKEYFSQFKEDIDQKEKQFEKDLKKLENRLEKLQEQKDQIDKDYEKFNSQGSLVYENYAVVEELLTSINKAGKEKGWDVVHEKIKSDERLSKLIKKLSEKNNEIILNL